MSENMQSLTTIKFLSGLSRTLFLISQTPMPQHGTTEFLLSFSCDDTHK